MEILFVRVALEREPQWVLLPIGRAGDSYVKAALASVSVRVELRRNGDLTLHERAHAEARCRSVVPGNFRAPTSLVDAAHVYAVPPSRVRHAYGA